MMSNYKSACLLKLLIVTFTLAPQFALLAQASINLSSRLPLGLTYDGRMLWQTDTKTRILKGYDLKEKKALREIKLRIPGIRDIEFWRNYILAAYENYLYKIDPINGNIVERIQLPLIRDPISLAVNGNLVYIYDRKDNLIYMFDIVEKQMYGSLKINVKKPRGMVYFRRTLWLISKDKRAQKIDAVTGEILGFVPVASNSYGITFASGKMYVSIPDKIIPIEYVETDTYISSSPQKAKLNIALTIKPLWSREEIQKENELSYHLSLFPFNEHQRTPHILNNKKRWHLSRSSWGDRILKQTFIENIKKKTFNIELSFRTYNNVYLLRKNKIKEYFSSQLSAKELLPFLDYSIYPFKKNNKAKTLKAEWDKKNEGKHPYKMLPFLEEQKVFDPLSKVAFFRLMGVPARLVNGFDLLSEKPTTFFQIYLRPIEWVPITKDYKSARPREFPISNKLLILSYPDSVTMQPKSSLQTKGIYEYLQKKIYWEKGKAIIYTEKD